MSSAAFAYPHKSAEAFRTISEVAVELDVPQHVLRFWESRFAQIRPVKRAGGRRYYRPEDVDLLKGIRALLYSDGLTIRGVLFFLFRDANLITVSRNAIKVAQRSSSTGEDRVEAQIGFSSFSLLCLVCDTQFPKEFVCYMNCSRNACATLTNKFCKDVFIFLFNTNT